MPVLSHTDINLQTINTEQLYVASKQCRVWALWNDWLCRWIIWCRSVVTLRQHRWWLLSRELQPCQAQHHRCLECRVWVLRPPAHSAAVGLAACQCLPTTTPGPQLTVYSLNSPTDAVLLLHISTVTSNAQQVKQTAADTALHLLRRCSTLSTFRFTLLGLSYELYWFR